MKDIYPLRIDAYSHIAPEKYRQALEKEAPRLCQYMIDPVGPLHDLDHRFRLMDRYQGLVQVIAPSWPSVEFAAPKKAVDLARIANDEMANLLLKYPERFVAGIACLPMNDMDAALKETDRAINELRFRGVLIYTPINDKPLDSPEFMPLYEKMAQYDLPILIHPMRALDYPDYRSETESKYRVYMTFGWPYETTVAMTRIVFSGILEKYPNLKFLTHHCGGMVPFLEERIKQFYDIAERRREIFNKDLRKQPIDYYRMFYNDTAIYGNMAGLMVGYNFGGPDHLLFAVDFPLGDMDFGSRNYRQTINAIEAMEISEEDRKKIYQDNAKRLFRLPV